MTDNIHSNRAPEPVGAYPHAKRVGDFIFFSGIGARQRGTFIIPGHEPFDFEVQCRTCFDNFRAVVDECGLPWLSVADVTIYLINMKRDFAIYNRVYAEYFAGVNNPNPTRTTLEILSLPTPIAVEIKAVCYAKEAPTSS